MLTREYKEHYKKNFILAYPVIIGQAGHMFTHISDSIMVGNIGSVPLAASSLAGNVFIMVLIIGIGIGMGMTPIIGKANGEKNPEKVKDYLKNAILLNMIIGIILTIVPIFITGIFYKLNQPEDVLSYAIPYFEILAYSMLPYMIFMTFKQFLEGIELTKPAMYASIVFNLLNIVLNYIFIYGKLGFPAMGLNGAGWATFIAKLCMGLSLAIYIAKSPKLNFYLKNLDLGRYSLKKMKELLRLGVPIALQYVLEVGAFAAGAVMMGWFGAVQLAAHNIALNPAALTYLMSSGISAAATIRISNFIGKRDFRSMKVAGNASYIMVLLFMGTCAIALISLRYAIPTVYIKESDVINAAANLLIIAGFFQLFDGIQVVSLGALRGMEDVKVPTLLALFAYWGVSLPGSYIFAVVLDIGAIGVWY